jgi:hypothetical protein
MEEDKGGKDSFFFFGPSLHKNEEFEKNLNI